MSAERAAAAAVRASTAVSSPATASAASAAARQPYSVEDTPAQRQAKVEAQTGVVLLPSDSPTVRAAKVLYQSINGGASTAAFNAAAAAVGGDIDRAVGWDGSREGAEKLRKIHGFAKGGMHSGGLRIVGEEGYELEATGPARYYSHSKTKDLLSGSGSSSEKESPATATEVRALRAEFRAQMRAMIQSQKTLTKLAERWDVEGLPAERVVN
jgi:hypothetical protein